MQDHLLIVQVPELANQYFSILFFRFPKQFPCNRTVQLSKRAELHIKFIKQNLERCEFVQDIVEAFTAVATVREPNYNYNNALTVRHNVSRVQ